METEAESVEPRKRNRPDASDPPAWAMALHTWVSARAPKTRRGRITLAIVAGVLVIGLSLGLLILPLYVDLSKDRLQGFGYGGVFLANLLSTATVFVPVPGLTAVGQALIIQQGNILNPVYVGLLGGTGMALGEITAYAAGAVGSEMVEEEHIQAPRLVRPAVVKIISWINWLMDNYGFATLLVLSAIPNPAFELAGITAGASRMNFPRFMVAVLIGKNIRGLGLAFLGAEGVHVPWLT
jgi:membrane protein DedA with SNARE-associated domain